MNLVTGYRGYAHITSNDQAALHRAVFGSGHCVMDTGSVFAASFADVNVLRIADGEAMIQGHHMRIAPGEYDEIELTVGTNGMNRVDYIAIRYSKDSTGIESAAIVQICGTPASGAAIPPALTQQDTNRVNSVYEAALYRVVFTGLSVGNPIPCFTALPDLQAQIANGLASLRTETESSISTATQTAQNSLNITKQDLQSQINGKQAALTGAATTIANNNLTASRVLISNGSGKVTASGVTDTELARIAGLSGNAQSQFDGLKNTLNGIGVHYLTAASGNLASKWEWTTKSFDTASSIPGEMSNLASRCSGGFWLPPKNGLCVASVMVTFGSNKNGSRGIRLELRNSSGVVIESLATTQVAAINHAQRLSATAIFCIYSGEKFGICVEQDSGSTLAVSATARILFVPDY